MTKLFLETFGLVSIKESPKNWKNSNEDVDAFIKINNKQSYRYRRNIVSQKWLEEFLKTVKLMALI